MKTGIICLLFVFLAKSVHAQTDNRETIFWLVSNYPPKVILDGPDRGKGYIDQLMQSIFRRMPQFRHEIVMASLVRKIEEIKTKPNACGLPYLRTPEREAVMDLSSPIFNHSVPANGIITTRKRLVDMYSSYLNERRELRFNDFLASEKYRIGVIAGRSYGKTIDPILKANPNATLEMPSTDNFISLFMKLVNQDEFDGVLGYPMELKYVMKQNVFDGKGFVFLPIAGAAAQPSHVGCSKTPLGRQVIAGINKMLEDASFQHEAMAALRIWLDEETARHIDH